MILTLFGLLLLALVLAKGIDCSYVTDKKQTNPNGRTEVRTLTASQKVSNMIFRLLLVTFMEIFICLLINFKAPTDSSSDFEAISRIVSISMLAICSIFILLMFLITTIESDPERDPKEPHMATLDTLYLGMAI